MAVILDRNQSVGISPRSQFFDNCAPRQRVPETMDCVIDP